MAWMFNPYSPCCCLPGQYCPKIFGCQAAGPYNEIVWTSGFHIEIKDADNNIVGTSDEGNGSTEVCFDLEGDTEYTVRISKDRWETLEFTFTTPCSPDPWEQHPNITMTPASGYACPCHPSGLGDCVDPIKLPLVFNDGFGDITMDQGNVDYCAQRSAANVSPDCCSSDDLTSGPTPIVFHLFSDCNIAISPLLWCPHHGTYGELTNVLSAGPCDSDPCFFQDPFSPCGSVEITSISVACDPFRIEYNCVPHGCMTEVYGGPFTATLMESA